MIELTLDRTKELLAAAVAEKGADYVYTTPDGQQSSPEDLTTCLYVHGDQPGCIVGHVLHKAGVSLPLLSRSESDDAEGALGGLKADGIVAYEGRVSDLLKSVQAKQDHGVAWGTAVDEALAELAG